MPKLNRPQDQFFYSRANETFMIGGRGMGKTRSLAYLALEMAKIKGSRTFVGAPTYDLLRGSTWVQMSQHCFLKEYNIQNGVHYVIHKRPPKAWGVIPFSDLDNRNVVTWRTGAYTVLDSLENYDKHRGAQYDRQLIDEFNNMNPDIRAVLLGCARGELFKDLDLKSQIYYAMTPPSKQATANFLHDLMERMQGKPDLARFIRGTSYDNARNLPKGYIEMMIGGMDTETKRREVDGEIIIATANSFMYDYDEAIHVPGALNPILNPVFIPGKRLYFFMDFNIGVMACSVWQLGDGWANCIDEFKPYSDCDMEDRCRDIRNRYGSLVDHAIFTGDASARNRSPHAKRLTFYRQLKHLLELDDDQLQFPTDNPDHVDSRLDCNAILSRMRIRIHAACTETREDFRKCMIDAKQKLDKTDPKRTHYLDAARYGWDVHLRPLLPDADALYARRLADDAIEV